MNPRCFECGSEDLIPIEEGRGGYTCIRCTSWTAHEAAVDPNLHRARNPLRMVLEVELDKFTPERYRREHYILLNQRVNDEPPPALEYMAVHFPVRMWLHNAREAMRKGKPEDLQFSFGIEVKDGESDTHTPCLSRNRFPY